MKERDRDVRRTSDELVDAATSTALSRSRPPHGSSPRRRTDRRALSAAVVSIVAVGVAVLAGLDTSGEPRLGIDVPQSSPVDTIAEPVRSAPTTTPDATVQSTSPTSIVEPVAGEYERVVGQTMPGSTEPIPAPGEAYAGIYFAYLHEGARSDDRQHLKFDVLQAFSGADCAIRFGDQAAEVCTPIGTDLAGPTARVEAALGGVPVTVRDLDDRASYSISAGELVALINGAAPADSAPTGFAYSGGFGFLLTYDAGVLIRLDQPARPGAG